MTGEKGEEALPEKAFNKILYRAEGGAARVGRQTKTKRYTNSCTDNLDRGVPEEQEEVRESKRGRRNAG